MARVAPRRIEEDERACGGAATVEWPRVGVRERRAETVVAHARLCRDIADELLAPEGPWQAARLAVFAEMPLGDAGDERTAAQRRVRGHRADISGVAAGGRDAGARLR